MENNFFKVKELLKALETIDPEENVLVCFGSSGGIGYYVENVYDGIIHGKNKAIMLSLVGTIKV